MRGVYSTRYPLLSRCQSACGHAPLSSGGVLAVCMQHARACMHVSLYVIAVRTYYFMCVPLGSGGFHRDFRIRYSRRTLLLRHVVAVFYILCHAAPVLRTRAGGGARAPASPTTTPDSTCTHQPAHLHMAAAQIRPSDMLVPTVLVRSRTPTPCSHSSSSLCIVKLMGYMTGYMAPRCMPLRRRMSMRRCTILDTDGHCRTAVSTGL